MTGNAVNEKNLSSITNKKCEKTRLLNEKKEAYSQRI